MSKVNTRGKKVGFTELQLRVLESIVEDPRISITQLAKRSRLTPRRVKKTLKDLQDGGGLYFTIRWDHSAFGDIDLEVRVQYDETTSTPTEIFEWFKDHYPVEYWISYIFGDEPILELILVIKNLRAAEDITAAVKAAPFTQDVNVRVIYPKRKFQGLGHNSLKDLLIEAGFRAQ
jgi:DNA-binding Lrp family transcriptional regulator